MTLGEADEEGRVSFVLVSERTQAVMLGKTQLQGSSKLWWQEHKAACPHL